MYSNNIVNFQESTTMLNACTKKSGNLLKESRISVAFFAGAKLVCDKNQCLSKKPELKYKPLMGN